MAKECLGGLKQTTSSYLSLPLRVPSEPLGAGSSSVSGRRSKKREGGSCCSSPTTATGAFQNELVQAPPPPSGRLAPRGGGEPGVASASRHAPAPYSLL